MKSLYFLKRDLRLSDNKTLFAAIEKSEQLALVYTLDNDFDEMSPAQKQFALETLRDLNKKLLEMGSRLFVFSGEPFELFNVTKKVEAVFVSKVYNSIDRTKQEGLKKAAEAHGVKVFEVENSTMYEIRDLPFEISSMPRVFTSFRKKIEKENLEIDAVEAPAVLPPVFETGAVPFENFRGWNLPDPLNLDFKGGESAGWSRIEHYFWGTDSAQEYKETRNGMLIFDDSTKFSPWLAVGALSARDIMVQLQKYEEERGANQSTYWISFELMWREYFKLYCLKYEKSVFEFGGIDQRQIEVSDNQEDLFTKWTEGCTGNDFVDANMCELKNTGWMSNRGRQNVASYLSKEFFVDWRKGAIWFAKNLLDYDVESNWGNWNYNAGVGVDPRDRKFNMSRQAQMYDPAGEYVAKFLDRS